MVLGSIDLDVSADVDEVVTFDRDRTIQQIAFCNRTGTAALVRLWIVPHEERDQTTGYVTTPVREDRHAWLFDRQLPGNSTLLLLEHDMELAAGDRIDAYSTVANVSVNVVGR